MPLTHSAIIVPPNSTGASVDVVVLPSGRVREVDCLGSPTVDDNILEPQTTDLPVSGTLGLPVREMRAGALTHHRVATASVNAVVAKGATGRLYGAHIWNASGAPLYLKLHDTASTPTAGSTAVKITVGCQAGLIRDYICSYAGVAFSSGIAFTIVAGIADNDATPVAANSCVIELEYL